SASIDKFARVAEALPAQLSAEREQILSALEGQHGKLTVLVDNVRQTLVAGTAMSTSLNTTLTTFDALMKRFGVGETNLSSSPKTNAQPFRIQDYSQTASQLEATARQLTELLATFDRTLGSSNLELIPARVGPVVQQAQSGGKQLVDYAFWKAIQLVGVILLAALVYRFVSWRASESG